MSGRARPAVCITAATCLAVVATGSAAVRPQRFDTPGQEHASVCAQLAHASAPLRFADGRPTGFRVNRRASVGGRPCGAGRVRLDLHEIVRSPAGRLVFHRGGLGYARAAQVGYGFLLLRDLSGPLPPPEPAGGGRGAPCRLAHAPPFAVRVRPIPAGMRYKPPPALPPGTGSGASFSHYGDPAAVQDPDAGVHFSYLLWSFLDVPGGGMVRALLAPGERVRLCAVAPVRMPAWDERGRVDGFVTARYVCACATEGPLYGWMVWSHLYLAGGDRRRVVHTAPVESAPSAVSQIAPRPGRVAPGWPPGQRESVQVWFRPALPR